MAVQTTNCLRVITRYSIPYKRRTVWLIKILALVFGAGGVVGVLLDDSSPHDEEKPVVIFLHYWGHGPAERLAGGFKVALDELGKKGP